MLKTVGIGDLIISNNPEDIIITHALATCVAVTVYCPMKKIGGMIHIALPQCGFGVTDNGKAAYFADKGLPNLFNQITSVYGCNPREMQIKLFGGALSVSERDVFNIGIQNIEYISNYLRDKQLPFSALETGSTVSRTIRLSIETGNIEIDKQPIRI